MPLPVVENVPTPSSSELVAAQAPIRTLAELDLLCVRAEEGKVVKQRAAVLLSLTSWFSTNVLVLQRIEEKLCEFARLSGIHTGLSATLSRVWTAEVESDRQDLFLQLSDGIRNQALPAPPDLEAFCKTANPDALARLLIPVIAGIAVGLGRERQNLIDSENSFASIVAGVRTSASTLRTFGVIPSEVLERRCDALVSAFATLGACADNPQESVLRFRFFRFAFIDRLLQSTGAYLGILRDSAERLSDKTTALLAESPILRAAEIARGLSPLQLRLLQCVDRFLQFDAAQNDARTAGLQRFTEFAVGLCAHHTRAEIEAGMHSLRDIVITDEPIPEMVLIRCWYQLLPTIEQREKLVRVLHRAFGLADEVVRGVSADHTFDYFRNKVAALRNQSAEVRTAVQAVVVCRPELLTGADIEFGRLCHVLARYSARFSSVTHFASLSPTTRPELFTSAEAIERQAAYAAEVQSDPRVRCDAERDDLAVKLSIPIARLIGTNFCWSADAGFLSSTLVYGFAGYVGNSPIDVVVKRVRSVPNQRTAPTEKIKLAVMDLEKLKLVNGTGGLAKWSVWVPKPHHDESTTVNEILGAIQVHGREWSGILNSQGRTDLTLYGSGAAPKRFDVRELRTELQGVADAFLAALSQLEADRQRVALLPQRIFKRQKLREVLEGKSQEKDPELTEFLSRFPEEVRAFTKARSPFMVFMRRQGKGLKARINPLPGYPAHVLAAWDEEMIRSPERECVNPTTHFFAVAASVKSFEVSAKHPQAPESYRDVAKYLLGVLDTVRMAVGSSKTAWTARLVLDTAEVSAHLHTLIGKVDAKPKGVVTVLKPDEDLAEGAA